MLRLALFSVFKDDWFCVQMTLFAVRLAESQWEKSIYSLLSLCSAWHARENSNKVILSEDFKFSNAKYVRDYWCATAEIKYMFQVALSTFFCLYSSPLHFTFWQLCLDTCVTTEISDYAAYYLLATGYPFQKHLFPFSETACAFSLSPGTERKRFCFPFFCY